MEATTKPRLHPLLTAAAISVTVFSAVGVGALTGLLPTSHSSTRESSPAAAEAPAAPSVAQAAAVEAPTTPAAPAAAPAPKHVKKHVAHATPKPVVVAAAAPDSPQMAAAVPPPPPAPVAAAPAPVEAPASVVPAGTLGVVESVREVTQPGQGSALGPIAGGVAGALLGSQFGHGTGRNIMTIAGAAGGALAGKEVEKRATATKHWEVTVRLDDGTHRTISSPTAPIWHGGERVRLIDGRLQPA
jgi:outer membrane lipoprotein SlyB